MDSRISGDVTQDYNIQASLTRSISNPLYYSLDGAYESDYNTSSHEEGQHEDTDLDGDTALQHDTTEEEDNYRSPRDAIEWTPYDPGTISASLPARLVSTRTNLQNAKLLRRKTIPKIADPNLVTWNGPEDPTNPHNWPRHRKWTSVVLVAAFAFIAPMASTIVAPALDDIALEFNILQGSTEAFLVMSIFLLAFAIGPFLWGPLSEVFGRVRVMQGANLIFLLFNTVCGFARTKEQMMAFRFLSGIGGSAAQAIGGGIVSDCFKAGERGTAVAVYSLMPFISPAIAPIIGAYLTQYSTWRWSFWGTSIFDLLIQVLCIFLLRETFTPAILGGKAKQLQQQTGNSALHTKWQGPEHTTQKMIMKSLVRPFIMLTTQPALQTMALYRAYQYGLMYLAFATFPMVFQEAYNQSVSRASWNYLSLGVGFVTGLQFSKSLQDKIYQWCKKNKVDPNASLLSASTWWWLTTIRRTRGDSGSHGLLPKYKSTAENPVPLQIQRTSTNKSLSDETRGLPEYRLPLLVPFSLFIPVGLSIYGWSAQAPVHWIVPNIGCVIFAMGLIVCFNCAQAYVIDTYTTYSASATGAAAFVRTMAGFGFPLFAPRMYRSLGVGTGNTVLAMIALTFGVASPFLLWRYGAWLRSKSTYCSD